MIKLYFYTVATLGEYDVNFVNRFPLPSTMIACCTNANTASSFIISFFKTSSFSMIFNIDVTQTFIPFLVVAPLCQRPIGTIR